MKIDHQVLVAPITTEKMYQANEAENSVGFWVHVKASKLSIKKAIQEFFNVKVEKVWVANYKPKKVTFKQRAGTQKARKKAYVKLRKGDSIEFSEE